LRGKCEVRPRTRHEGPEGEWIYSATFSLTSALDGGGWSTPRPGGFTPGNDQVPFVQEAGWAQGPFRTGEKNLDLPGFNPRTVQPHEKNVQYEISSLGWVQKILQNDSMCNFLQIYHFLLPLTFSFLCSSCLLNNLRLRSLGVKGRKIHTHTKQK